MQAAHKSAVHKRAQRMPHNAQPAAQTASDTTEPTAKIEQHLNHMQGGDSACSSQSNRVPQAQNACNNLLLPTPSGPFTTKRGSRW
jgi:hypothetical protein